MKKNKELRIMAIVALTISIISLGLAYVAMNLTMKLKSLTSEDNINWAINFSDLNEKLSGDVESKFPELISTSINNMNVVLYRPGDSVSYEFKIKNTGRIDARLNLLKLTSPTCIASDNVNCNYIKYEFKYLDGSNVKLGDTLAVNNNKDVIFTITYDKNAEISRNPKVTLENLDLILIYEQG